MNIEELKMQIESDELSGQFMIFKYSDNTFLVNQYLEEICAHKMCGVAPITSLAQQERSPLSLVFTVNLDLNVLRVDEFSEPYDYSSLQNTIVICNKIDKKIAASTADYVIDFPVLVDWQAIAYMEHTCPGLSSADYAWLYEACGGDIYKILNELDKVAVFPEASRGAIFGRMKCGETSYLFAKDLFGLSNSIMQKDLTVVYDYLARLAYLDYDPIALTNILLNNYKKIAFVKSGKPAKELGLTDKQVYAIKKNYSYCSAEEIFSKVKFLANIDLRLKDNKLACSAETLISYLINKILE